MIQHTTHLSPYLTGKHMAHFGGTLRGLPYGPGPAQDAAIVGFNDGMAERSERNAPPPLVDVDLGVLRELDGGLTEERQEERAHSQGMPL